MTALDILTRIGNNLSERKSTAALSNYEVLCNNITHLNDLLSAALADYVAIRKETEALLGTFALLEGDFAAGSPKFPFTKIVPRILANGVAILEKFLHETQPDKRDGISVDNVGVLKRGFPEFSNLATATRQAVDSLVSDSYQLSQLDPEELNYHVLVSLNSFDKFVTPSIRHALFTDELVDALNELRGIPFHQWKQSPITRCQHQTFAQKVDYILPLLADYSPANLGDLLKDTFKFTSEITHIGYVSTFFSTSAESEVIFADDHGPYLPSTENFSELKYELLVVCCALFSEVYLPCVLRAITMIVGAQNAAPISARIATVIQVIREGVKTRNAKYYFLIKSGITRKSESILLPCKCGRENRWDSPFKTSDLYCKGCGSSFNLIEIEGDSGYVFTSAGPIKVIGSDVPEFHDLPSNKQQTMLRKFEELSKQNK